MTKDVADKMLYYTTDMHDKAFILPAFAHRKLNVGNAQQ